MPDLTKLAHNSRKTPQTGKQTQTGEEEERYLKLVAFPQCVISMAAHNLVALVHQALQVSLLNESRSLYLEKFSKEIGFPNEEKDIEHEYI
jgi:hypothetical protein